MLVRGCCRIDIPTPYKVEYGERKRYEKEKDRRNDHCVAHTEQRDHRRLRRDQCKRLGAEQGVMRPHDQVRHRRVREVRAGEAVVLPGHRHVFLQRLGDQRLPDHREPRDVRLVDRDLPVLLGSSEKPQRDRSLRFSEGQAMSPAPH